MSVKDIASFSVCPQIRENIVMNIRQLKDVFRQVFDYEGVREA